MVEAGNASAPNASWHGNPPTARDRVTLTLSDLFLSLCLWNCGNVGVLAVLRSRRCNL